MDSTELTIIENLLANNYSEVQIAKLLGAKLEAVRAVIATPPKQVRFRFSPGKVKWAVEKYKDGQTVH